MLLQHASKPSMHRNISTPASRRTCCAAQRAGPSRASLPLNQPYEFYVVKGDSGVDRMYFEDLLSQPDQPGDWGSRRTNRGWGDVHVGSPDWGSFSTRDSRPQSMGSSGDRDTTTRKREGVDVLPMCLIKPVADGADTITAEELQAQATWGVRAVQATGSSLTGEGVKVALLDTGLDDNYRIHPAFQDINVVSQNFTSDLPADVAATHDNDGHGTHCLGTILGRDVGGLRIGVAPGIRDVVVAKVVPDAANGTSGMLAEALLWAWEQDANVINISLAYDLDSKKRELILQNTPSKQADDMVQQLLTKNLILLERIVALLHDGAAVRPPPLVIAACGNGSTATGKVHACLPAAAPGVLSVAAAEKSSNGLKVASFSNLGAMLCGPGVAVCSAAAGSAAATSGVPWLRVLSGTSMAAPHVTGVAALWWQRERLVGTPEENIAQAVAEKLGAFASSKVFESGVAVEARGRGLVQAPLES